MPNTPNTALFVPHAERPSPAPSEEANQDLFYSIHTATRRGNILQIRAILSHVDTEDVAKVLDTKDPTTGLTCLAEAVIRGHRNIVIYYLLFGVDHDITDNRGWTPLHWAIFQGYIEIACHLMKFGARVDVNALKDSTAPTPYQLSIDQKFHLLDSYLIRFAADLEQQNATMTSIFHNARAQNNPDALNVLWTVLQGDLTLKEVGVWNLPTLLRDVDGCKDFAQKCLKEKPLPNEYGTVDLGEEEEDSDDDNDKIPFASDSDGDMNSSDEEQGGDGDESESD